MGGAHRRYGFVTWGYVPTIRRHCQSLHVMLCIRADMISVGLVLFLAALDQTVRPHSLHGPLCGGRRFLQEAERAGAQLMWPDRCYCSTDDSGRVTPVPSRISMGRHGTFSLSLILPSPARPSPPPDPFPPSSPCDPSLYPNANLR